MKGQPIVLERSGRIAVASVIAIGALLLGAESPALAESADERNSERWVAKSMRMALDSHAAGSAVDNATTPTTIGVIARPSVADAAESSIDFNNNEGTLALAIAPFSLFDPWSDTTPWQLSAFRLTAASNTEQKNITFGGRWDYTWKDPRVYFSRGRLKGVSRILEEQFATCGPTASNDCLNKALASVVDGELKKAAESPFGISIAGNATYNNDGDYDGSTATVSLEWEFETARGAFPITANARWEDARPADSSAGTSKRDRQAGGGIQVAYHHKIVLPGREPLGIGGGFAATALACVQNECKNDDATLRLNPFASVAVNASMGVRLDFVWEGNSGDFRDAVAGLKLDYSFSGM